MGNRIHELGRMVDIMLDNPKWDSLTFFQYDGSNYDENPLSKIRVDRGEDGTFIVSLGTLTEPEQQYADGFRLEYGCWPDDHYEGAA